MSAVLPTARPSFALDPALVGAVICLAVVGAVMVGSASIPLADRNHGAPFYFLLWHLVALAIGCVGLGFVVALPSDVWHRASALLLVAGLALLVLVLVPALGRTTNGSTRWLMLGPISVQASEPARLCLLLYCASYAVRRSRQLGTTFMGFMKPMGVVALAAVLLLLEPDYGAAVVLTATSLAILFVGGGRVRDFLAAATTGGTAFGILAFSSPYRAERMTTFLDPWEDAGAEGYQLTNSLMAIGRGEWFGVGLGESMQKLAYLPEAHTDFVFAVLAEELGFIGATLVVVLYAVVVYRAITLGQQAIREGMAFQGLVATGIGVMLGIEAFINLGVNTGMLPTKGLALPLVSYGRSSMVVTLAAVGFLVRIHHELNSGQKSMLQRGRVQ